MYILVSRVRGTCADKVKHWQGNRKKDVCGEVVPQLTWMVVILCRYLDGQEDC